MLKAAVVRSHMRDQQTEPRTGPRETPRLGLVPNSFWFVVVEDLF